MTASSSKQVRDAVWKTHGLAMEKDVYASAAAVLASCKQDAACYVRVLDTPVPSTPPAAKMGHVKAAWMAAIHGTASTRAELLARVDKVKDGSVRLAIVTAIAHLAPEGDVAAAGALEAIVEDDANATMNYAGDEVLKVARTLRSRVP
jgi:hypothetical protein